MTNTKGTPKSLEQAILNGIEDQGKIEAHVRDYLAQVMGIALLRCQTPSEEALIRQAAISMSLIERKRAA